MFCCFSSSHRGHLKNNKNGLVNQTNSRQNAQENLYSKNVNPINSNNNNSLANANFNSNDLKDNLEKENSGTLPRTDTNCDKKQSNKLSNETNNSSVSNNFYLKKSFSLKFK